MCETLTFTTNILGHPRLVLFFHENGFSELGPDRVSRFKSYKGSSICYCNFPPPKTTFLSFGIGDAKIPVIPAITAPVKFVLVWHVPLVLERAWNDRVFLWWKIDYRDR